MFGFIRNFFSGILSFFSGLLGGKKSQDQPTIEAANKSATPKNRKRNGFFMELDEANETKSVEANKPAATNGAKTPEPVAAATTKTAKTPEPVAAATTKTAKTPEPVAKTAENTKNPEPAANGQAPRVELVQTAKGVKPEPVKAPPTPIASTNGQKPTDTTFAPKYLNPSTNSNSRRRPGPNMSPYLDMARQVKTSK